MVATLSRVPEAIDEVALNYDAEVQKLEGRGYAAKVLLDPFNQRLKVQKYEAKNLKRLIVEILDLARHHSLTKISVLAGPEDWETFLSRGFVLEGVLKQYFLGEDGYQMSRVLDASRRYSERLDEENELIEDVIEKPSGTDVPRLPAGLTLRVAGLDDTPALAAMYRRVFETYPTPIHQEEYLANEIEDGTIYKVIWAGDELVSAAGGARDFKHKAVEITECGTVAEYRGRGLITFLIDDLQTDLQQNGFRTLFAMARARSYGMNLVFRRFGYRYRGRLINHVHICGHFEDLNVWVRNFS